MIADDERLNLWYDAQSNIWTFFIPIEQAMPCSYMLSVMDAYGWMLEMDRRVIRILPMR